MLPKLMTLEQSLELIKEYELAESIRLRKRVLEANKRPKVAK